MAKLNPCGECHHFDPVLRGTVQRKWGWCAKKSVYAEIRDTHTAPIPEGAQTGPVAKPVMVKRNEVKIGCTDFQEAGPKPDKASQLVAAVAPNKAKRDAEASKKKKKVARR